MEEEYTPQIFVDFTYVNDYGSETNMSKTVDADYMSDYGEIGPLCALFHDFLMACGFTYLANKRIEFVDED